MVKYNLPIGLSTCGGKPLDRANLEDMKKSGILASVSLAQFIQESGYGKTELAQNANNCFGMKCTLSGNTILAFRHMWLLTI